MSEQNSGMDWAYGLKAKRVAELEKVIGQAAQDLSLLVAKHKLGNDRTAQRMTKYLRKHKPK